MNIKFMVGYLNYVFHKTFRYRESEIFLTLPFSISINATNSVHRNSKTQSNPTWTNRILQIRANLHLQTYSITFYRNEEDEGALICPFLFLDTYHSKIQFSTITLYDKIDTKLRKSSRLTIFYSMKPFQHLFPYSLTLTSRIFVTDRRRKASLLESTLMCSIQENNETHSFQKLKTPINSLKEISRVMTFHAQPQAKQSTLKIFFYTSIR